MATSAQLSPPLTFLAINGARLTAEAQETYVFVDAIYEANQFSLDKLVLRLRSMF
jgi:prophage maintenance system killer protein